MSEFLAMASRLRRRGWAAAAVAVLASFSASGWGQSATDGESLLPGQRVRIFAPDVVSGRTIGNLSRIDRESITVSVPGRSEPLTFPREKVMALDLSAGARSRGIDSLIGAGIGIAVGAGIGAASHQSGNGIVNSGETAAVGAVIGAVIPPGERWRPAAASSYRFSLRPRIDHERGIAALFEF